MSAALWSAAFTYQQPAENASGGVSLADEIALGVSASGYAALQTALFNQLNTSATGDLIARCSSLGDYVVGLVAKAVYGNYRAVAPIVNDAELTSYVDNSQNAVANPILYAILNGGSTTLVPNGADTSENFTSADLLTVPLGNVLATMIKNFQNRFINASNLDQPVNIPFQSGDAIEFTVTFNNLRAVQSSSPSDGYQLTNGANTNFDGYNSTLDINGYINGNTGLTASPPVQKQWVLGVTINLTA